MPAQVRVQLDAALAAREPPLVADVPGLRRLLQTAARAVLRHADIRAAELSVTLLDDARIAGLNAHYLAHDGPTDVISFPLYQAGELVVGDVYIGAEQAARQAASNRVAFEEELARLTIHGVLHVLGYDHSADEDRVTSEMWLLQEELVQKVVHK